MHNKKYTDAQKIEALRRVDSGEAVYDVAKALNIEKNTLYLWTSKKGRRKLEPVISAIRDAGREHAARAPIDREPSREPLHPLVLTSPTDEVERLRRENEFLRRLVSTYREMAGL